MKSIAWFESADGEPDRAVARVLSFGELPHLPRRNVCGEGALINLRCSFIAMLSGIVSRGAAYICTWPNPLVDRELVTDDSNL